MAKKKERVERFADVLGEIRDHLNVSHKELARRFGVSPRTIVRWLHHHELPSTGSAYCISEAIRGIDPNLRRRALEHLGMRQDGEVVARKAPPPADPARVRDAVDAAILAAAETMDMAPKQVRATVAAFLGRVVASGVASGVALEALLAVAQRD